MMIVWPGANPTRLASRATERTWDGDNLSNRGILRRAGRCSEYVHLAAIHTPIRMRIPNTRKAIHALLELSATTARITVIPPLPRSKAQYYRGPRAARLNTRGEGL
jgi:hypothetical protein